MRSLGSLGTGFAFLDARDDFRRARRRHALVYIARCLLGRRRRPLRALADAAAVGGQPRLRVIALDSIVGAMESLSCFDDGFRPSSETARQRWERIALAHRTGIALPPIEVLEHPDGIYVIDGCHRVSVARALGHKDIEARVRRPPQPTIADTVAPSAARASCTLTAGVRAEPHHLYQRRAPPRTRRDRPA
jgi:ParB-like nuclease domain